MRRAVFALICITSLGVALGQGPGHDVEVEIRLARAAPYPVDDPDVAEFTLKLDLRLANRSQETVYIPKAEAPDGREDRVTLINFEARQADGTWAVLSHASWYGTSTTKYEPCISLPPGGSVDLANLSLGLVLLKTRLVGLTDEPTVRLGLWFLCKQPDGKTPITGATTGEFKLRLPAQP